MTARWKRRCEALAGSFIGGQFRFRRERLAKGSDTRRGFTLLEALVVIAILSLAALAIPPSLSRWHTRTELRKAELALDQLLNRARQEAVRGHRAIAVRFSASRERVGIPALDLWHDIPVGQKVTILGVTQGFHQDTPAIVFLSDGHSTGGSVTIEQEGVKVSRRVGWLSGRIDHGRQ